MTDRPILKVNVEDDAFADFQKRFAEYNQTLGETREAWREGAVEAAASTEAFDKLSAFLEKHHQAMEELHGDLEDAQQDARYAAEATYSVGTFAQRFSGHVATSTKHLLKWTGVLTLFSTIFAGGGLIGIGRLAADASQERRSANELGVTYGERQGFSSSFSRLGNTDAILGWVGEAQRDPGKRWILGAASGGQEDRFERMSTADAAAALLPLIQARMKGIPSGATDSFARAYGIPTDLARVLRNMSPEELRNLVLHYQSNKSAMSLPRGVLKKWDDLNTTFDEAEEKISTAFINKLVRLVPSFDHMTAALTKLIDKFLAQGGPLEKAIEPLGKGLKWLGDNFSAQSVEEAFRDTYKAVERFAHDVQRLTMPAQAQPYVAPVQGGGRRSLSNRLPHDGGGRGVHEQMQEDPGRVPGAPGVYSPALPGRPPGAKPTPWDQRFAHNARYQDRLQRQYDERYSKEHPAVNPPGTITPNAHPVRYEGHLRIDNDTFDYATGGNHGAFSSPPGDQVISSFTPPGVDPRHPFNAGYFRIEPKYDPLLHRYRSGVLIHESSHGMDVHQVVSSGCFAVPRSQWPALEEKLKLKLDQLGGRAILRVGSDGNAEVVPMGTPQGRPAMSRPASAEPAAPKDLYKKDWKGDQIRMTPDMPHPNDKDKAREALKPQVHLDLPAGMHAHQTTAVA